jgi:hypothetical protein
VGEKERDERPAPAQCWTDEGVETGPLEHDRRFVADDPAIVSRRDVDDIVGAELVRRSVCETDRSATGEQDADVARLAPLSAHARTHML